MNLLFWLLSGELILLAISVSLGLFIANKRREQRLHEAAAKLLQSILDAEPQHLEKIQNDLLSRYPLTGKKKVEKLGNQILLEERTFFRELMRVLLTSDMEGLSKLHHPLHDLMGRQMDILHQLGASGGEQAASVMSSDDEADQDDEMGMLEEDALLDDDMDALLQAATMAEEGADEVAWDGGEENDDRGETSASASTGSSAAAGLDDDDDMDALLMAATMMDDDDGMLIAGGDQAEGEDSGEVRMAAVSPTQSPADESDDEMDALLQSAALAADFDEDSMLVAGGDDVEGEGSGERGATEAPSTKAAPDDDIDALLMAATMMDDDDGMLIAGGDEAESEDSGEVSAAATPPAKAAPADAPDDDIDALLMAATMMDDDDGMLIAGGDEAESEDSGKVSAAATPPAKAAPADAPDDDIDALLMAATMMDDDDGLLIAGGDGDVTMENMPMASETTAPIQESTPVLDASALRSMKQSVESESKKTETASKERKRKKPGKPDEALSAQESAAPPDEFAAMLDNLTLMETASASGDAEGTPTDTLITGLEDDLDLDIEDILQDLLLAEDNDLDDIPTPSSPETREVNETVEKPSSSRRRKTS